MDRLGLERDGSGEEVVDRVGETLLDGLIPEGIDRDAILVRSDVPWSEEASNLYSVFLGPDIVPTIPINVLRGWTAVTADGSLSAHFEHTVVITEGGPEVLTSGQA